MSRICEIISSKNVLVGNNVSHSNRKTKRRFLPNLQNVSLVSDALLRKFSMRICTNTLRSIDINGGFDNYLITTANENLTLKAQKIKKAIKAKIKAKKTD
jgi:large subunit ribosomal protein L28